MSLELGVGSGGDHGGVVGAKSAAREIRGDAGGLAALFEGCAELGVGRYTAGDEYARGVELLGGNHRAIDEVADDGVLELADERERLRGAQRQELFELAFASVE